MKTRELLSLTIKGFFIGIGSLIPGVSGGTTAIVLGVFEDIIYSVGNIVNNFKKSIITLLPIAFGGITGILTFSPLIAIFCKKEPIISKYVFCLISIISLFVFAKRSFNKRFNFKGFLCVFIGIVCAAITSISITVFRTELVFDSFLSLFLISLPLSLALILPAISFSYMLLFFGIYENFLTAIKNFDINYLLPMMAGLILGSIILAKILTKFLQSKKEIVYHFVFGFVIFSLADIIAR